MSRVSVPDCMAELREPEPATEKTTARGASIEPQR